MRFLIINSDTKEVVEEHNDWHHANDASRNLNQHEVMNDRVPIYYSQPTCPLCDSDEMGRTEMDGEAWKCHSCGGVLTLKGKRK